MRFTLNRSSTWDDNGRVVEVESLEALYALWQRCGHHSLIIHWPHPNGIGLIDEPTIEVYDADRE